MIEIFSAKNWFLIAVLIIWIFVAVIQDFRKREVANWWNFSLIIIALAYRAFLSIYEKNYLYFVWGIFGLALFYALANAFYYARLFAGGDAKLMIALGAILPLTTELWANLEIFAWFFCLFLISGAIYGIVYSAILSFNNRKRFLKEFLRLFRVYKKTAGVITGLALLIGIASLIMNIYLIVWLSIILFASPWLLLYAKAVEEVCMIKKLNPMQLTIGDWLVNPLKIGKKKINPYWQGLSERELRLIQKNYHKKVLVKYGIPFTPTFLIAFILLLIVFWFGLNVF